jgi:hypothetical protein
MFGLTETSARLKRTSPMHMSSMETTFMAVYRLAAGRERGGGGGGVG